MASQNLDPFIKYLEGRENFRWQVKTWILSLKFEERKDMFYLMTHSTHFYLR